MFRKRYTRTATSARLSPPGGRAKKAPNVLGRLLLTAFVLWIAAIAVRRMQISYGAET